MKKEPLDYEKPPDDSNRMHWVEVVGLAVMILATVGYALFRIAIAMTR